jgi:DNA gyrase subunit A
MVTKNGYIKKTALREYANVRRNGLIAINLQEGDELDWVTPTSGKDEIIIATALGKAIRFGETEVRAMGRDTQGVIGIKLGKGDSVAGMGTVTDGGDVLVITERGYGKRTPLDEYRLQGRAGKGIIDIKTAGRNGAVVGMLQVREGDDILVVTTKGKIIRVHADEVTSQGRNTMGVRIIDLDADDQVGNLARVEAEQAAPDASAPPAESSE